MRKLVTVRTISALSPIEGADAIECATIDGWKVVVKKGEFRVGDPCVYFEIDSFLPASDERFAFLHASKSEFDGREGYRLRTIKLRGQVSQGLALPVKDFAGSVATCGSTDLAAELGVVKWEPPMVPGQNGLPKGAFPSFIQKTDQERVQNLPNVLAEHGEYGFEVTVKLDGSSMTVYHRDGEVGVCSRNLELQEGDNAYWRAAHACGLIEALKKYGRNIAVQGELIGEGIQGNPEKIKGQQFWVFDVFDIDEYAYMGITRRLLSLRDLEDNGALLNHVPTIKHVKPLRAEFQSVEAILALAEGPSLHAAKREGVVFKRLDGKFSFKAIANSYLLKNKDR